MVLVPYSAFGAQPIWYVNGQAAGSNSGLTWQDAFTDLHDALAVARSGDEVWIAGGIYKPDRRTKDRSQYFQLVSGVSLFGGFAGHETDKEQRDRTINETVLSGDLNGDDGPQDCPGKGNCCVTRPDEFGCDDAECQAFVCGERPYDYYCCNPASKVDGGGWNYYCAFIASGRCCHLGNWRSCENSYLILRGDDLAEGTVLDGLTIFGGYPYEEGEDAGIGTGLVLWNSVLTLTHCTLRGNWRGMQGSYTSVTLHDCAFLDNAHTPVSIDISPRPNALLRCRFVNNGYGSYVDWVAVEDCVFRENRTSSTLQIGSSSVVYDCMFLDNKAIGLQLQGSNIVVSDCFFAGHAGYPAIAATITGAVIANSVFTGQRSLYRPNDGSPAITSTSSSITINNCLIANNTAMRNGGIRAVETSLRLYNSTIADNYSYASASFGSSAGVDLFGGSLKIENSIIWGNRSSSAPSLADQIHLHEATATVNHSIVEDWDGSLPGLNTFDADPRFVPGPDGDYYLRALDSPAVNVGNDAQTTPSIFTRTTRADETPDASPVDLGFHYPITGRTLVLGDSNRDGEVNLRDFAGHQRCFSIPYPEPPIPNCRIFDLDGNGRLDPLDWAMLLEAAGF